MEVQEQRKVAVVNTQPPANLIETIADAVLRIDDRSEMFFNLGVSGDRHVDAAFKGGVEAICARETDLQVWGVLFGLVWSNPDFQKWGSRDDIPGAEGNGIHDVCRQIADRAWVKLIRSDEFHKEAPWPGVLRETDPIRWEASEAVAA